MKQLIFMAATAMLMSDAVMARPVSYPGGITVMQMNDMDSNQLHLHYSHTARYSIGYKAEYWDERRFRFNGAQFNYLVKRWNRPASQANVYIKSALGVASNSQIDEPAGFISIAADWEDRRYFIMASSRYTEANDIDSFSMHKLRAGFAPYIGDYGDLHTWLMVQIDHNPDNPDSVVVTPLVRLFKGVHLAEFGVSDEGDALFNLVIRF